MGWTVGRIPFASIDRYATRMGYDDPDEFRLLLACVRSMDDVFVELANKNRDKGDKKT